MTRALARPRCACNGCDPPLWAVAAGLTVSVGVGVAAGYWPAQRAAGLDPAEALRHE
jgi:putative ABC transport system permease protein